MKLDKTNPRSRRVRNADSEILVGNGRGRGGAGELELQRVLNYGVNA